MGYMRLGKLRQIDLNLLIVFAVTAEEKSATKASARLLLSHRLSAAPFSARSIFQDELMIRSSSGFELTLRGRKILEELEQLLPKIEGLVLPSI
jgi:DNA-binding transcriptional LysR family regulator